MCLKSSPLTRLQQQQQQQVPQSLLLYKSTNSNRKSKILLYEKCNYNDDNVADNKDDVNDNSSLGLLQKKYNDDIWNGFMQRFQGDFDNYNQVMQDRKQGKLPREGGGHEHFHCTLIPLNNDNNNNNNFNNNINNKISHRLAAFYLDGLPNRIFRLRFYELIAKNKTHLEMYLYTLHPNLEQEIRNHAEEPHLWPKIVQEYQKQHGFENTVQLLPKCEICWSLYYDPIQHEYITLQQQQQEKNNLEKIMENNNNNIHQDDGFHAVMVHGFAIVNSTIIPGTQILIKDQLSLYENSFYIHDRGYDVNTGKFIYGNQQNVPYKLDRVSTIHPTTLKRTIVNQKLQWTIGPEFRTEMEYNHNMDQIGGPSSGLAMAKKKKEKKQENYK